MCPSAGGVSEHKGLLCFFTLAHWEVKKSLAPDKIHLNVLGIKNTVRVPTLKELKV